MNTQSYPARAAAWPMLIRNSAFAAATGALMAGLVYATAARSAPAGNSAAHNKVVIQKSFDDWAAGTGGPYRLLEDDATWEITGRSAASKVYPSREAFMSEVIRPFNARMKEPLKPKIRAIYGEGDTVIVLFDAAGVAKDGKPYANTYSWYLHMADGKIAAATAFFDSIAFNDLWSRVSPDEAPR